MALAEKEFGEGGLLVSLDLPHMKGVRNALVKLVNKEYEVAGLKGLEGATPEEQKRIVKAALYEAREKYVEEGNYSKLPLIEKIEEVYGQGKLTLPDLLQGLGLKTQEKSKGGLRKFLGLDK